ncbi:glycosyltransferase family 2 protein [Candidatus Woesebacteria bacterium]|nr:MAG: glycosyltransferase family 2 protein [Candidatus Woesebacteria bacterium]
MKKDKVSFVIPTLNSSRTIEKTLSSIRKQKTRAVIEILIADGGSTDTTLAICKKYKCKIYRNNKVDLIYGKQVGYNKATGDYIIFIDSDEVLENVNSVELKLKAIKTQKNTRAVITTGYKTPLNYSKINYYINSFGDPFTQFVYKESKDDKSLITSLRNKYRVINETKDCVIFDFANSSNSSVFELWAGGCMIDATYTKKHYPHLSKHPEYIALLFYLLIKDKQLVAITKNDPTLHYSTTSLATYVKKIVSRVKNNIFRSDMGKGGYVGREVLTNSDVRLRKYLFILYGMSLIFPLVDGVRITISKRNYVYMIHPLLVYFTLITIVYYYIKYVFNIKTELKTYGK